MNHNSWSFKTRRTAKGRACHLYEVIYADISSQPGAYITEAG